MIITELQHQLYRLSPGKSTNGLGKLSNLTHEKTDIREPTSLNLELNTTILTKQMHLIFVIYKMLDTL